MNIQLHKDANRESLVIISAKEEDYQLGYLMGQLNDSDVCRMLNRNEQGAYQIHFDLKRESHVDKKEKPSYSEAMGMAKEWWREKGRALTNFEDEDEDKSIADAFASFAHDLVERGLINKGDALADI